MILEIQHETEMEYSQPVSEWLCELRMEPVSDATQRCHSFQISVGQPVTLCNYLDGFGNRVPHFNLLKPPTSLRILAASVVETEDTGIGPMASQTTFSAEGTADGWHLPLESLDYLPLRGPARATPLLDPVLTELRPMPRMRVGMWVCQVAEHIRGHFEYASHVTDATSPIDHLLTRGKGVCQDFTHLMIAVLRLPRQWAFREDGGGQGLHRRAAQQGHLPRCRRRTHQGACRHPHARPPAIPLVARSTRPARCSRALRAANRASVWQRGRGPAAVTGGSGKVAGP